MKKVIFFLFVVAATGFVQTAKAQTAAHSNRSDCHIPPAVKRFLDKHPAVKKKAIRYVKNHPNQSPCSCTATPAQVATLAVPVRATAGAKLNWPQMPATPAAPPMGSM